MEEQRQRHLPALRAPDESRAPWESEPAARAAVLAGSERGARVAAARVEEGFEMDAAGPTVDSTARTIRLET